MHLISIGHGESRYGCMVEAKSAAARLTMEVRMRIIIDISMMAPAQFIACAAPTIVDDMDEMMLPKQ